jgi:DNA-binding CsgD family transcriptional regulator
VSIEPPPIFIAPRTAEHHVGAVLAKLGVASRQAAFEVARDQQLVAGP